MANVSELVVGSVSGVDRLSGDTGAVSGGLDASGERRGPGSIAPGVVSVVGVSGVGVGYFSSATWYDDRNFSGILF